jgi:protein transport protein SEC61 subunit alpha
MYVCESANMFLLLLQLLYRKFSGNFLVNLIGIWKESEYSGHSIPVGGLAYYVTAPSR